MKSADLNLDIVTVDSLKYVIVDKNEHIQSFLVRGTNYEKKMLDYIKETYKNLKTVIDVGACIGTHSLPFSQISDKVYSFEPFYSNFNILFLNVMLNEIKNVFPYNMALGNKNCTKLLNCHDNGKPNGNSSFYENKRKNFNTQLRVPMLKLDEFKLEDVDLIKIDTEQYNVPILEGMVETLKQNSPDIFIECSTNEDYVQVENFLNNFGYKPTGLVFNATPTFLFKVFE